MKRNVNLAEISDGRLYRENDMVKADCHGCRGCSHCCRGMGNSVILDPCDLYRLQAGTGKTLGMLLEEEAAELNVREGIILPNLKMKGPGERCAFLGEGDRCTVHSSRPGICRLFPLGRYYEDGDFRYFLQIRECREKNRSKIKVAKWIDMPDGKRYHAFVLDWHNLLNGLEARVAPEDMEGAKRLNLLLLETFYMEPYDTEEDFYTQFARRKEAFARCAG